jgi:hypothetical protein
MFHAQQTSTEELDYSINWSPVLCPTGATLLSSRWTAVGATGLSLLDMGLVEEWFADIKVSGGTPGSLYVWRNDVIVWLDGDSQTVEERIEFYVSG